MAVGSERVTTLLRADLEHFGESLWRNDEIGERRFNFFLTLATSVIGGLAALYGARDTKFDAVTLLYITRAALLGLVIFGLLTYLRLLQRDRVTDELHATLRYIRNRLADLKPDGSDPADVEPAVLHYAVPLRIPKKHRLRWLKGGLAQMAGVMTGGLLALLVYSCAETMDVISRVALTAGAGGALAIGLVYAAIRVADSGNQPAQYFRAGVGAVIINADKKVLALERRDAPGAWQMPQGGLEISEEPAQAIYRELFEEIRIPRSSLGLLGSYPDLLAYELPAAMRSAKTGRGQVQRWFLFELKTPDAAIDPSKGREFVSWRWMPCEDLLAVATEFRRPMYEKLFQYFRPHLS